jgi:hypothetical protein
MREEFTSLGIGLQASGKAKKSGIHIVGESLEPDVCPL